MASEQFSLCWDNFHVNMSSGMHSLLEKEDLVDVTLAIEGQYLKAHKMVLSVCSPYFRKLFSTNPCKHPIFFMKDVTYEVMNDLLTFMYQGEVQVNQDNLATFIKTAEALQIKGLTGENREVDDALKEVNSLKRPPPFPDESKNRLNRSKPNSSAKKMKTSQESPELQREESYIEQASESIQLKVEPNEQVEDAESYGWGDDSYLNETENLPDDSQVDEAEECHMMEEEPKASTSLEGAIPNQDFCLQVPKDEFLSPQQLERSNAESLLDELFNISKMKSNPRGPYKKKRARPAKNMDSSYFKRIKNQIPIDEIQIPQLLENMSNDESLLEELIKKKKSKKNAIAPEKRKRGRPAKNLNSYYFKRKKRALR